MSSCALTAVCLTILCSCRSISDREYVSRGMNLREVNLCETSLGKMGLRLNLRAESAQEWTLSSVKACMWILREY